MSSALDRALRAGQIAARVLPDAWEWIRERIEGGESEAEIRRDIQDRRDQIARARRERDRDFETRFGRRPTSAESVTGTPESD